MELNSQLQAEINKTRSPRSPTAVYRSFVAAIIKQAIDDVKGICCDLHSNNKGLAADQAMCFILSEDCKYYCSELEIDYKTLKDRAISLHEDYKKNHPEVITYRAIVKSSKQRFKIGSLTGFKRRSSSFCGASAWN